MMERGGLGRHSWRLEWAGRKILDRGDRKTGHIYLKNSLELSLRFSAEKIIIELTKIPVRNIRFLPSPPPSLFSSSPRLKSEPSSDQKT